VDVAFTAPVPFIYYSAESDGHNGTFISGTIQMEQKQQVTRTPELAAKNRRLAIVLALAALGFYVGFLLLQLK
jgi:hypothetical protein